MITRTIVTAAAMAALMAGAAHAGDKAKKQATAEAAPPASADMPAGASTSPYASSGAMNEGAMGGTTATAAGVDASAVVSTQTVTNGPVADTPENRAKYGQPMSRAGKRTEPAGN